MDSLLHHLSFFSFRLFICTFILRIAKTKKPSKPFPSTRPIIYGGFSLFDYPRGTATRITEWHLAAALLSHAFSEWIDRRSELTQTHF